MADILVVEDDEEIAGLLELVLMDAGYHVRLAGNGVLGLKRLSEALPDLVDMDVEMPVLGGPRMAERMFLENCGTENVPVVIVSGVHNLPEVAVNVGTPYYVSKPFLPDRLVKTVQKAIEEHRIPRPSL